MIMGMSTGLFIREAIAVILLIGSLFFFLASAIGMIRLPDFYTRLHASGNSETLGLMLACLGLVIHEGPTLTAVKIVIVFFAGISGEPYRDTYFGESCSEIRSSCVDKQG